MFLFLFSCGFVIFYLKFLILAIVVKSFPIYILNLKITNGKEAS